MDREFSRRIVFTVDGRRFVKAAIVDFHTYHPECVDYENLKWGLKVEMEFVSTQKSCCHKCGEPLYKKSKEV